MSNIPPQTYRAFAHQLPYCIGSRLFGDRERFGRVIDPTNPMWIDWQKRSVEFYGATQRRGVGVVVNRAGYVVMRDVDLSGKRVLEIGPAALEHMAFWNGKPTHFTGVDVNTSYLEMASERLKAKNIPFTSELVQGTAPLPFADNSFDVVLSFSSLEHIQPIEPYLLELRRVLRSGGIVAGSIPCEGGLAWGLGRFLTSRRWLQKNTTINPDFVICWEHPNFADEILNALSKLFAIERITFWPLLIPLVDVNLVAKFLGRKV